jgi:hypothetical protein
MIKKYYFFTQTIPNNRVMSSLISLKKRTLCLKERAGRRIRIMTGCPISPNLKSIR